MKYDLFHGCAEEKVSEREVIGMIDEIDMIYFTSVPRRRSVREKS